MISYARHLIAGMGAMAMVLGPLTALPAAAAGTDLYRLVSRGATDAVLEDGDIRINVSNPAGESVSCTPLELVAAARAEGAPEIVTNRTSLESYDALMAYLNNAVSANIYVDYFSCKAVSPSAGFVGLLCADANPARPASSFEVCAGAMLDIEQIGTTGTTPEVARTEVTPNETEVPSHIEVYGSAKHDLGRSGVRIAFLQEENGTLTISKGAPASERSAACSIESLRAKLAKTEANVWSRAEFVNFNRLKAEFEGDSNDRAYVWFAECEGSGDKVKGLACIAPSGKLDDMIRLTACAYAEGTYTSDD